jgi:hypothetical protein
MACRSLESRPNLSKVKVESQKGTSVGTPFSSNLRFIIIVDLEVVNATQEKLMGNFF